MGRWLDAAGREQRRWLYMAGHAKDGTLLFAHHAHQDDGDDEQRHPTHPDEMKRTSLPRTRSRDGKFKSPLREDVSLHGHTSVIKGQEYWEICKF